MAGITLISMPATTEDRQYLDNDHQRMATAQEKLAHCDKDREYVKNKPQQIKTAQDEHRNEPSNYDRGSSSQSSEECELKKQNEQLLEENKSLKEEMQDFENKLSYLEYALGVIDGNGVGDIATTINPHDLLMEENDDDDVNDDSKNITLPIIDTKPISDEKHTSSDFDDGASPEGQSKEIKSLQAKNQNMLTAIKSLAKAAIVQKKKHDRYKSKSTAAKKKVASVSKKLSETLLEKQEYHTSYLDTRTLLLKEKDKNDELQSQVSSLHFQIRNVRSMKETEREEIDRILQRLEEKKEDVGVVSQGNASDKASDSVQMQLTRKKEIIAKLQSKIDLAISYMKKAAKTNGAENTKMIYGNDSMEADGFVILSNKSTRSTTESELSC